MIRLVYFVKFSNHHTVDRFVFASVEEMFLNLRDFMLRNGTGQLEWMIRE